MLLAARAGRLTNGRMTRADSLAGDRACGSMMFPRARESLDPRTGRDGKDVLGCYRVSTRVSTALANTPAYACFWRWVVGRASGVR